MRFVNSLLRPIVPVKLRESSIERIRFSIRSAIIREIRSDLIVSPTRNRKRRERARA